MPLQLLLYFTLFFAAAMFWPTWRLWRREGVNAFVLPRDDSVEGYVGRWFRFVLIGIPVLLAALSAGLPVEAAGPLTWLDRPALKIASWAMLAASLVWVVIAQAQMGISWRIGIDARSRPPLVRSGVFSISRNPIFLGMRAALLGLFLALPNAATLTILIAGEILIQVQVRLEEAYLGKIHGAEYRRYTEEVRRWIVG